MRAMVAILMVGVCVLVNFLKSDECAKGVGIFVSVFNAV